MNALASSILASKCPVISLPIVTYSIFFHLIFSIVVNSAVFIFTDSYGDKKDDEKKSPRGGDPPSRPAWVDPVVPAPAREEPGSAVSGPRGNYARYHEALQKRMKEREENKQKQIELGSS